MKHMEFRHLKQCIQHSQRVNTIAATSLLQTTMSNIILCSCP